MSRILQRLPFHDGHTSVGVEGSVYRVLPLQIIVWVSLGPQGLDEPDSRTPRIPAVLDPAFTDGFLIHAQHLGRFAGLRPQLLRPLGVSMRTHDRVIPLHGANVWLHPNVPGRRDEFSRAGPFLLEMHRGIGITSGADLYPRLPLLGARALRAAKLHVSIDYSKCRVTVSTERRFWFFS